EVAQARPVSASAPDRVDDPVRRGDADVRRDEQLLERVERFDVDRPRPPLPLVSEAHEVVEAFGDLLLRAGEAFPETTENGHRNYPVSASARCRRSTSAPTAERTSDRPASTSAICATIGSSTPCLAPSAIAAPVVRTPSATIFIPARTSDSERPRASSM